MKKLQLIKCLAVIALALSSGNLMSQDIENSYINMPEGLNPIMTKEARMELLEYYKAGQIDTIQNRFGNPVYLQLFDTLNNHLLVKNTETTTLEMKLFQTDNQVPVIGIISSVCAPICQSVVEFYDTAWNKIPLKFDLPKAVQWVDAQKLNKATSLDSVWVKNILQNSMVSLRFDNEKSIIIATNNSVDLLDDIDRKVIMPILDSKPIIFELKDRTWIARP